LGLVTLPPESEKQDVNKASKLRELISRPGPIVISGAHNGISAVIGEEAGFDGLWASGFEISASYAVPDANILTMADNLHAAKMIDNVTTIPVVADCDNGYGNAINVIRCVEEYERAGIAAICIEDNIFPKRCSFYAGVQRELSDVEEHAAKVRAAKATARNRDFTVIARTEALSVKTLHEAGFKLIIMANHAMRSAIKAMTETLTTLRKEGFTGSVDDKVVPLERVYSLVGVDKMKKEEKAFLPSGSPGVTAVILAAGQSQGLLPLTEEVPKPMLDIKGKTILERQIDVLNACGVKEVAVVRGYKKEAIGLPNIRYYDNDEFASSSEVFSLFRASKELGGPFVFLYGDILFERGHLEKLLKSPADISILVDRSWAQETRPELGRGAPDLVVLKDAQDQQGHRFVGAEAPHTVAKVGRGIAPKEAHGEFVGLGMFTPKGARMLTDAYRQLSEAKGGGKFHEADSLRNASFTDLLQELVDRGAAVQAIDVYKGWLEIDTFEDYRRAWTLIKE
jgi:phosphoenolpyruvate phosphomutase